MKDVAKDVDEEENAQNRADSTDAEAKKRKQKKTGKQMATGEAASDGGEEDRSVENAAQRVAGMELESEPGRDETGTDATDKSAGDPAKPPQTNAGRPVTSGCAGKREMRDVSNDPVLSCETNANNFNCSFIHSGPGR